MVPMPLIALAFVSHQQMLPPAAMQTVFNGSTPKTPLIFVLSPGVDPTAQVNETAQVLQPAAAEFFYAAS